MNKKIVINMNDIEIKGDILDVSRKNSGIIYKLSKDIQEEISVDYVNEETKNILKPKTYDACTFFFNLSSLLTNRKKECLIKDVINYLKDNGEIYIWDINKESNGFLDYNIEVALPDGELKKVVFNKYNPFISCKFEEVKKILQKYSIIEETKLWEDIFYIKAIKNNS